VTRPYLDYPFAIDGRGRAATTGEDEHIRDLIEQVLFTSPGERVNRPDFGCGLRALLFMPNSDALAVATQVLTKGALQRWLEEEIRVDQVEVRAEDERLVVTVAWTKRTTGESRVGEFATRA
jgi:phage baseplate assembly protein W